MGKPTRIVWIMLLGISILLSACAPVASAVGLSATATPPATVTPVPTAADPGDGGLVVTLDDAGRTIELNTGGTFLLKLGEGYDWTLDIGDQAVISRVRNVMVIRGAQGLFEALKTGQTSLAATGDPQCRQAQPPCAMPTIEFKITIVVR